MARDLRTIHGVRDFTQLTTWQKAMEIAEVTYRFTPTLPSEERFGLQVQMRRAAVSIPSNIAEGNGRRSDREFARFAAIAYGSASELQTQALIAQRARLGQPDELGELLDRIEELRAMLSSLISRLRSD